MLCYGLPVACPADQNRVFRVNANAVEIGDCQMGCNRVTDRLELEQINARTPQVEGLTSGGRARWWMPVGAQS